MSAINEFKKLLKEAAEAQKKSASTHEDIISEETVAEKAARYLSNPRKSEFVVKEDATEAQRWNDPLRREPNERFVTFKEMNEHYGLFLQRIQQQMSTIGGGGEVNLRGLDDVLTSTTGTNKFLTYNPSTRKFYFDFINPATESELGGIIPGAGFTVGVDGTLGLNAGPSFYLDESDIFRLRPGSADLIGGIKAGPGIVIDSEGTLFIETEGLPFSFGDFSGLVGTYSSNTAYALLSSINEDEDIVIASNGDGGIKVVGEFRVYAPNGSVTAALEDSDPFFQVKGDGQIQILVPLADTQEGGVEIIGSELGTSLQPGIAGTMLHMTGNADLPTRVYHDTLGDYSSYVFRRYNGSVITPTQVLDGEAVGRINFTAATDAGMGSVAFAQIRVNAIEDQTTTAQGSEILLFVTPEGDIASNRITALEVRASGVTSDVGFVGDLTGNVTGDVSGTAGSVAAANVTGTTLASNVVTSSLTTVGTLGSLTVTNAITGGSVSDSIGNVRSVPINGQSGAYNLAATDNGKMISITTGGVSVLQNVFADPYGQIISIYNNSNTSQTITQGAGVTLRLAGTVATGNRTLARYGVATITCVAANTFVISGAGVI